MKIGRNKPCTCGSGKKYKFCCGRFGNTVSPSAGIAISAAMDAQKASEILRQNAEGFGRPIVSAEQGGYRIVAVKDKVYWHRDWQFFTDFLLSFMKQTMGIGWATRMRKNKTDHPIFEWLSLMNQNFPPNSGNPSGVLRTSDAPYAFALFRFSYALYLIAHNDMLPKPLLKRLRDPSAFWPAALETLAFAAFVLAGFKMEMGEKAKSVEPQGEFAATAPKTGIVRHIEVKRRDAWQAEPKMDNPELQAEIGLWIKRKLYQSAKKKLECPVYWFELSLPIEFDESAAEALQALFQRSLREAEEEIEFDGEKPSPAYVFLSNHSHFQNNAEFVSNVVMFHGFHIKLHNTGDIVEIEQALEERDRDRDMKLVLESFKKVQHVPHHFDGTVDGLVDDKLKKINRLKVGEKLRVEFDDRDNLIGLVTQVQPNGEKATVVLLDEKTNRQHITEVALTEDEQKLAARYGAAVFGNPSGGVQIPDEDPLALYEFFLEAQSNTSRKILLEAIQNHPKSDEYSKLDDNALLQRVCREWTKSALSMSKNPNVKHTKEPKRSPQARAAPNVAKTK